jgi:hypothetical protein
MADDTAGDARTTKNSQEASKATTRQDGRKQAGEVELASRTGKITQTLN